MIKISVVEGALEDKFLLEFTISNYPEQLNLGDIRKFKGYKYKVVKVARGLKINEITFKLMEG